MEIITNNFIPKTYLGKWTIGLIVFFFAFLGLFFIFVKLGERGGETFFSNPKLAISILIAAVCGIAAFFSGIIGIVKNKERSILVFLATLIGFFVLFWSFAEIAFPH